MLVDCSSGCQWFHPLAGAGGKDWGVCASERSPRSGMLTFEHQGGMFCFENDKGWVNYAGKWQDWPNEESLRLMPPLSENTKPIWQGPIGGFLTLRRKQREAAEESKGSS